MRVWSNLVSLRGLGGSRTWMERIVTFLRAIGPYAAIELLLPGGSLIALLLWLYRRQRRGKVAVIAATSAIG
jgi:uncharacterized membrane protein